MRYEWDEAKRLSNIQKQGIDFVGIEKVFAGTIWMTGLTTASPGSSRWACSGGAWW
jgi:uncharacterized DUF497 family protein